MSNGKINKLEITMVELKTDIEYIKESLIKNDNKHVEIQKCITEVNNKIDDLGGKFASKKIEAMVYSILAFIFITLFGIIGYLLDKYVLS